MIEQFEKLIDKFLCKDNPSENHKPPNSKKQKTLDSKKTLSSLDIVIGIYRLLKYDLKKYSQKWNLDLLVKYLDEKLPDTILDYKIKHKEQDTLLVKWFIIEILCMLLPVLPSHKENIFKHYFNSNQIEQLKQKFQLIIMGNDLDYLNMKINENVQSNSKELIKTNFEKNALESHKRNSSLLKENLDVKLTKKTQNLNLKDLSSKNDDLVLVNTTKKNIERLELATQSGDCIIVEGALSSGKTSLIHYLADKHNVKLIKYQIDDNMDDKALIGNYVCSHIPGEFMWKPGPLYQAVYDDCWLVLEDFDHSPIDSLSLLIDLLETKCLKTSSNASLTIKPNFRLFLTSRTGLLNFSNSNFIDSIKKLSRKVDLKELDQTEIIDIICQRFPKFKVNTKNKIVENILDTLTLFTNAECLKYKKIGQRTLSLRDLFKLFERLNSLENGEDRKTNLLILNDIYDVFLASIQDKLIRIDLCTHLATRFNINKDEAITLILSNKPNFEKRLDEIICGRVRLSLKAINTNLNNKSSLIFDSYSSDKFVYTKQSLKLLEQIARCIECNEPVLLSGETGVGKTSSLQHLARLLGKNINVINLSQQTETSDLLGNFKPVDIKSQMKILKENFMRLFSDSFNINENKAFLTHINNTFLKSDWKTLMQLLLHATNLAHKKFLKENKPIWSKWKEFEKCLMNYNENLDQLVNRFSFQFFEGVLTKAIVNGEWIILDEINLASPETLQFLNPLLENNNSQDSSIVLYEKGSNESLVRHRDFRLFGAMNPASDIGKRNLPDSIRNRFTEIFVNELDNEEDFIVLIREYLHSLTNVNIDLVKSIVEFYMSLKNETFLKKLSNGTGAKPTYSLRTLCRALKYASYNLCNNSLLSVYDGLCLSFLTDLNRESSQFLEEHIKEILFKSSKSKVLSKINRKQPSKNENLNLDYINIEDYWIIKGLNEIKQTDNSYIFTKSIKENLRRLVRVCSAQLPCLIQGDTSIGKTSLIKWLANATGNTLIRINNHDHTDLQEYVGSYVIEPNGNLTFKEGLLATAMRNGYWILLDELNLASSEVLEALNRVLDDNRELYIPETQELIKAHPRFILFATQNPPGKYAGRKQLSRAFRNRFIELHFEEVPEDELLEIVEKKCQLPNSYARLLIRTVIDLKTKRSQMGGIFLGKHSLITLRDLFRWAKRYSSAIQMNEECSDWKQYLAEQGLLILASRCRSLQDVQTIHSSIQSVFGKKIDLTNLDSPMSLTKPIMDELNKIISKSNEIINESAELKNFVWTPSAKRTALFVSQAYKFNEPFLLVGETGIGKTTICQILSRLNKKNLHIMNCHMHSEASDFLGSIRPVRSGESTSSNQLFEWQDGPLIDALRQGQDFLIDEISLADDSVLERLNSVLEDERSLLLAENTNSDRALIKAHAQFRIFATMNPGGDFGKKELSAALRNRFTEIWCPTPNQESDEFEIICNQKLNCSNEQIKRVCVKSIISFLRWLKQQDFFNKKTLTGGTISIRDLIKWINFINKFCKTNKEASNYFIGLLNGACLVFIDALNNDDLFKMNPYQHCITHLIETIEALIQLELNETFDLSDLFQKESNIFINETNYVKCGPFEIIKGDQPEPVNLKYSLDSKSTRENLLRILRSLLMDSPIMLEGSPGVGKTSIIEAIGALTRNKVVRINLSEQTDLSELFGADLPVASESNQQTQQFNWIDGPFLVALKKGYWIILDEINLASQSVLEGLNSCFDHRGEIYLSELNKKFQINKTQTKIFACQNPYLQGGGRKGLPKSFLNRFSKVYINKMSQEDLLEILSTVFNQCQISRETMSKMIQFNDRLHQQVNIDHLWGTSGSPWEFNLRDLFRWCEIMTKEKNLNPADYVYLIYASRFRFHKDKLKVYECFRETFGYEAYKQEEAVCVRFAQTHLQIGQSFLSYQNNHLEQFVDKSFSFTNSNLKHLEAVLKCLEMNWMTILVGHTCVGKTSLIRMLAKLINQPVVEFSVNSSTDTSDLLGGFAKAEYFKNDITYLLKQVELVYIQIMNKQFETNSNQMVKNELLISCFIQFSHEAKCLFIENLNEISLDLIVKLFEKNLQFLTQLIQSNAKLTHLNKNTNEIKSNLKELIQKEKNKNKKKITFEWLDSALVKAIEQGEWVLIDNSNFCSPSVLDRLNPLLEPNGCIQINEKGLLNGELATVRPHKNFRLILCMNEYFGELSRPMRNRGIEIYLNEFEDHDDERSILKNLYSFNHIDFEYYFKQINLISLEEMKRIGFADRLKLFRMIYDYYLLNSNQTALNHLKNTLNEFKLDVNAYNLESENQNELVHFFSDVSKLKEIPLYRYLFNFPLFSCLISKLIQCLSESFELRLTNIEDRFMSSIKLTQYIEIWLQNVNLNSISSIFEFTYSYLMTNLNKKFKKSIESLQQVVINPIFDSKKNKYFNQYLSILIETSDQIGLDLLEENLDLISNKYLIHKLIQIETLDKIKTLNNVLKAQIFLYLFKFRLNSLYQIEHESLLSMVKNLENNSIVTFKFILMFYDLCDIFIQDTLNAIYLNQIDYASHLSQIKSTVYYLEQFYLLISCNFDSHLTVSYLKYNWNLIHGYFVKLNQIWSLNFRSLHDIFHKCLSFDDSVFQQYRLIWRLNRPNILITNVNSLQICHKLNNTLMRSFKFSNQSNKDFIEKIYHLKLKEDKQIESENAFTDETLLELSQFECCSNIEKFFNEISKSYTTRTSVSQYLNSIYYSSQLVPFENFIQMSRDTQLVFENKPIKCVTNLCELFTRFCSFGKFNFLFQQSPSLLVSFFVKFENFIQNLTNDTSDYDSNETQTNLLKYLSNEKQIDKSELKSTYHYDWTSDFLTKFYFNTSIKDTKSSNDRLKIELAYYELKLEQIKRFVQLGWQNHSLLQSVNSNIDTTLFEMLKSQLNSIKEKCFSNNQFLLQDYLIKKGYENNLFNTIKTNNNSLINILKLSVQMVYLFAPCEPLDPFEYDQLIEKSQQNELTLSQNELKLVNFIREFKLKSGFFTEVTNLKVETQSEFYSLRQNKSDYFFLMNEINNGLSMFCSKRLVNLVNKLTSNHQYQETLELEYQNFISTLEKFIQKISNEFYSFSDVVYLPLNAMSLIGYSLKGLFTNLKKEISFNQSNHLVNLVNLLQQYPLKETHLNLSCKLVEYSTHFKSSDIKLSDQLCLLSLMHLINSLRYTSNQSNVFYELCVYFNQRYNAYKQYQEDKNKVEEFKYKTYGQQETSSELDEKELAEHFPSYTQYFDEFVRNELDDKKIETKQDEMSIESTNELIDLDLLSKANDLIEIYAQKDKLDNEFYEKNSLQTFYKSYSLAFKLQMKNELTLDQTKDTLRSHLMYSSSLNFDFTYDISTNGKILNIYDFYKNSNRIQVLKCKRVLNEFSSRLIYLLNEWDNNPILIELIKIIQRIELFDLNDPLVKYLTGLELLVERAQRWQLIESKMTSIEKELKETSDLIVEWRKFELNFWLQSLDLELISCRKKSSYKWFNHIFSVCLEFLNENVDTNDFLNTLKQFLNLSQNGDYLVRLKQLKICFNMFKNESDKRLSNALWNVYEFYNVLYTNAIIENINKEKELIEKELKDFINICRWQDMNYWALKQSTQKYNKGLFKIIKKFRSYLSQRIDFNTKQKQLEKELNSFQLSLTNFATTKSDFEFQIYKEETYHAKMVNICKKLLRKKCNKRNYNYHLLNYSNELVISFKELNDASAHIIQTHENKKDKDKYKKDTKYLMNQKLKFISDLLKKLNHMGLSYRRGNLKLAQMHQSLTQLLFFEPIEFKEKQVNESNFAYYMSLNRYFEFKSLLDQNMQQPNKDAHLIPIEKFRGYTEHFFNIILTQKKQLNHFLNKLINFSLFKNGINKISECIQFNSTCFVEMKSYAAKTLETVQQISLFLSSINNLESVSSELIESNLIKSQFSKLNEILNEIHKLDSNLKFPNESVNKQIETTISLFESNGDLKKTIFELIQISTQTYTPFESVFSEILNEFNALNKQSIHLNEITPNLDELTIECNKLKLKVLKSIENFFKKYSNEENLIDFDAESSLTNELSKNFEDDIQLLNLDDLNQALNEIVKLIEIATLISNDQLSSIKQCFKVIVIYLNTYFKFATHWSAYLNDNHFKTCKTFYALLSIFYDLKLNGLALPDELNENENSEEQEDEKNSNKFKTDDDDPKGLSSDAKGDKDVSDQIETEDQLDDAKRPEDREKENEQEDENKSIDENENGIEMSDDFESKLEDMENKEENNEDDNEKENEQDDELDDQKGDVDQAEDQLDEKLWDDNEVLSENELEESPNEEGEEIDNDNGQNDEEVGAKQDEIDLNPEDNQENNQEEEMKSEIDDKETNNEAEEKEEEGEEVVSDEEVDESNPNEVNETEIEEKQDQEEEEEENKNESKENDLETITEQESHNNANQNLHGQNENDLQSNSQIISEETKENEKKKIDENNSNEIEMNQDLTSNQDANPIDKRSKLNNEVKEQNEMNKKSMNENRQLADEDDKPDEDENNKNAQDLEEDSNERNEKENDENNNEKQDMRHLKQDEKHFDKKVFDAATENQKRKKNKRNEEEMNEKIEETNESETNRSKKIKNENEMSKDDEINKVKNEKVVHHEENKDENMEQQNEQVDTEIKTEDTIEETIESKTSTYVTSFDNMMMYRTREQVEKNLEKYRQFVSIETIDSIEKESLSLWQDYEILTQQMSKELCEQLKLILEPKICTKLKGDYKSGKRLNMKRVVEYLATEYRKDKIWLRRVKPFKRNYQVLLAIDNSSSMSDNHCIQLAYETIATLANAFNYLEVGQLGLLKFGDKVEPLHELQTNFSSDDGARIISQINFKDERTKIAEMLNLSVDLFTRSETNMQKATSSSSVNVSKLLFVLSDGRGIFYEGLETVKNALKDAIQEGIFIVFILLETQSTKSSIFDIKMPIFTPGNPIPTIKSYMEQFPFPFYVVLKDINNLSTIISEALKEWFDMLSRLDS